MEHFVEIKTDAVCGVEAYLRSCIGAFCVSENPTLDEVSDIKTAVSEAVTNVVVHAYKGGRVGEVCVKAYFKGRRLYIDVTDHGCGIDDIENARQAFYTTASGEERSGLGFTVMETFMDALRVQNNPDGGLTVSMEKELVGCVPPVHRCQKGDSFVRAQ